MDLQPEQLDLGFVGICRETCRVLLRAIISNNKGGRVAVILSALLLAHTAANAALLSLLHAILSLLHAADGSDLVLAGAYTLSTELSILALLLLSPFCTAAYVFRSRPPLYCTDANSGPFDRIVRDLPPYYTLFFGAAGILLLLLLDPSNEVVILLPLRVIGGAACLAGAAYGSVVLHISCVATVLEGADPLGVMRKSRALLAGKLWLAAAVFVPLDVCFAALQISFLELVLEDALGLGRGFQVAAGALMAVALWVVVAVTLVAQPVVYLVCKNHHHEVVDSGSR
ncbi:unnamed protein product [Alopecurus aequalis]